MENNYLTSVRALVNVSMLYGFEEVSKLICFARVKF